MSFPHSVWQQIKNTTADELIKALKKDGWSLDTKGGSEHIFLSEDGTRRVSIHYHPKKTYGQKFLKGLLADIGWSEKDLRRLKLIC